MTAKPPVRTVTFPTLDFPGRTTLRLDEISDGLRCSRRHVLDLVDGGAFGSINIAAPAASLRRHRVPRDAWLQFLAVRSSGPTRFELLMTLPRPILEDLLRLLNTFLTYTPPKTNNPTSRS